MDALRALRASHDQCVPVPTNTTAYDALAIVAKVTTDPAALCKLAAVDGHLASECLPKAQAVDRLWAAYTVRVWYSADLDEMEHPHVRSDTWVVNKLVLAVVAVKAFGVYGILTGSPNVVSEYVKWMASMPWNLPFVYMLCRGSHSAYVYVDFMLTLMDMLWQVKKHTDVAVIRHHYMPYDFEVAKA